MRRIVYQNEIWRDSAIHPDLWGLLLQKNLLIEITYGEPPFPVVLGVPHHAAPGVDRIAEDWENPKTGRAGRPADESTGLIGITVFTALREKGISSKLVIAVHPTDHDPNKTPGSQYWLSIFAEPFPRMIFELHGAASHRRHALELSAGNNSIARPDLFGKVLAHFLDGNSILAVQARPGSSEAELYKNHLHSGGRLQNPALETHSLVHAGTLGIPALHLEMKSIFHEQKILLNLPPDLQ